jgi:hypothetical protein
VYSGHLKTGTETRNHEKDVNRQKQYTASHN